MRERGYKSETHIYRIEGGGRDIEKKRNKETQRERKIEIKTDREIYRYSE